MPRKRNPKPDPVPPAKNIDELRAHNATLAASLLEFRGHVSARLDAMMVTMLASGESRAAIGFTVPGRENTERRCLLLMAVGDDDVGLVTKWLAQGASGETPDSSSSSDGITTC